MMIARITHVPTLRRELAVAEGWGHQQDNYYGITGMDGKQLFISRYDMPYGVVMGTPGRLAFESRRGQYQRPVFYPDTCACKEVIGADGECPVCNMFDTEVTS